MSDQGEEADDPVGEAYERFDCTGDSASLFTAAVAAREAVERGECIVLPTDTVYGIGADAFNADAVQRLLEAKNRGRDMPPPVLIAEPSLIRVLAVDVPADAKLLVDKHWPGPLTIICKAQPSLRLDLGDAEGTIALRVPDHELARQLLRQIGPMAVSSANLSGHPAAVSCDDAIEQLSDRVAVYLDAGRLSLGDGAPSTIVDFSQSDSGEVLRHGALSIDVLRETCPALVDRVTPVPAPSDPEPSQPESGDPESGAPESGQLESADPGVADETSANPAAGPPPPQTAGG